MTANEALTIVKLNCNTAGDPVISDADVATVIAQYKIIDDDGRLITDDDYEETYHIPAICQAIWRIKAGKIATAYNMTNGDQTLNREGMLKGCEYMVNMWGRLCNGSAQMPTRYNPLKEYPLGDTVSRRGYRVDGLDW